MELLNGGTLRNLILDQYLFNEKEIAFIIGCIASGLNYIHQHGIIHRDIKPENIVFDSKGLPHIADFGISYVDPTFFQTKKPLNCSMTSGTEQYCAPECLAVPHDHGIEVDYWSLGVVAYELFFLARPFKKRVSKEAIRYVESLKKSSDHSDNLSDDHLLGSGFKIKPMRDGNPEHLQLNQKFPISKFSKICSLWNMDSSKRFIAEENTSYTNNTQQTENHSISFASFLNKTNRIAVSGAIDNVHSDLTNLESYRAHNDFEDQKSSRSHASGINVYEQDSVVSGDHHSTPVLDFEPMSALRSHSLQILDIGSQQERTVARSIKQAFQSFHSTSSHHDELVCPTCSDSIQISLTVQMPNQQYYIQTKHEKPSPAFVSFLGMLLDIRPDHRMTARATECLPALSKHNWFTDQGINIPSLSSQTQSLLQMNVPSVPKPLEENKFPHHHPSIISSIISKKFPPKKLKQIRSEIGDFTFISAKYRSLEI